MNKQELINVPRILFPIGTEVLIKGKIVGLNVLDDRFVENVVKLAYGEQIIAPNDAIYVKDEPEIGHADEAPHYLKNILARLRELPEHDREVWLKAIMVEREKVKVPQFVADFIAEQKKLGHTLSYSIDASMSDRVAEWYWDNSELFALAWIFGHEVEEEKRYLVKMKRINGYGRYLNKALSSEEYFFASDNEISCYRTKHTRKELEEAGFGWVFDCPGIEIEEVE